MNAAPGPLIRGWCPTAWTPMAAGDGLLIRVRPRLGRLSRAQVLALCATAQAHGNGLLDLTNRSAIQLRGIRADWQAAVAALVEAGLVDRDPAREAAPALLVAPDWRPRDDTHAIATALMARIDALPPLPGKIGIAIDAGPVSVLGDAPADFRIERGLTGAVILRADGHATGIALAPGDAVQALAALAHWFVASGGAAAGRMARHRMPLPDWASGTIPPAVAHAPMRPGPHPRGSAIGLPFGRIDAGGLARLVADDAVRGLRLTPWRIVIVEGGVDLGLDTPAADVRLLSVDACVGAPACPQATVATRTLAERLAPLVTGSLHVSGCAKGCARARAAATVVTGRDGRFDLAFAARAGDGAVARGLTPDQLLARLEGPR